MCLGCGHLSCSHEPFHDLSLPIPTCKVAAGGPAVTAAAKTKTNDTTASRTPSASLTEWQSWREVGVKASGNAVLARLPAPPSRSQVDVSSCLEAFTSPEWLDGDDRYVCDACAETHRASAPISADGAGAAAVATARKESAQPALKWLQVVRAPEVLTLHIKRFRSRGSGGTKLMTPVPSTLAVDIAPFCSRDDVPPDHACDLGEAQHVPTRKYELCALIEHSGSYQRGHYCAYVRHAGGWRSMSDSQVKDVDEAAVLAAQGFLLFYRRKQTSTIDQDEQA